MSVSRFLKNLYGSKKTCTIAVSTTVFIIYYVILCFLKSKVKLEYVYPMLSQDMATLSGVLSGFLFTGVSILSSTSNSIIERLKLTGNIETAFKIFFHSIYSLVGMLVIYFLKPILVFDIKLVPTYTVTQYKLLEFIFSFGIYLFINGFMLFIYALYILNKILVPRHKKQA